MLLSYCSRLWSCYTYCLLSLVSQYLFSLIPSSWSWIGAGFSSSPLSLSSEWADPSISRSNSSGDWIQIIHHEWPNHRVFILRKEYNLPISLMERYAGACSHLSTMVEKSANEWDQCRGRLEASPAQLLVPFVAGMPLVGRWSSDRP